MNTNEENNRPFFRIDDPANPPPSDGTEVEGRSPLSAGPFDMHFRDAFWRNTNGAVVNPSEWRPIAPTPAPATSETPRVNAMAIAARPFVGKGADFVSLEDARSIERELTAATRRAEEAERERDEALKRCAQATKFQKNS